VGDGGQLRLLGRRYHNGQIDRLSSGRYRGDELTHDMCSSWLHCEKTVQEN
jgi:hypothetical protein